MSRTAGKKLISLRLDPELLDWFRAQRPKGYQTLVHSVLKNYMQDRTAHKIRAAGRAQELFRRYYSRCFWHYDAKLEINPDNMSLVIDGLRKYGGREGFLMADELCR